ncbi:NADPH:adrenodoxin oxidoreductase, mitochondrial isoform X2 [Cotesia typhae]|uniref:NADPH:adrenodoxin oxidoreductase, mitochondrial isoform X2 n=1 Tax=Cotesia typhae TaxID=2053667 RepID=UPI003D697889
MFFRSIRKLSNLVKEPIPRVCIIGSGPAGFYACQQLLKLSENVHIDILERLPVPYGLVRFGVAPDHPEVKNVINTFEKIAKNSRVRFMGNINVGQDISLEELKDNYHVVLLAYGSDQDKLLGIVGEQLGNVISGRNFVGWYNGVPSDKDLKINLNVEEAVIIGQGNVALDIARILLTSIDDLKKTDITSYALEELSQSEVKKNCTTIWRSTDFEKIKEYLPQLPRPKKRLMELMLNNLSPATFDDNKINNKKLFAPIFYRSPKEITGRDSVEKVVFSINDVVGLDFLTADAIPTCDEEEISCSLVFRSIGSKSVQIDESIPFDLCRGRVINSHGKVQNNLYATGWVATGPTGVILSTMTNAFQTGNSMKQELNVSDHKAGTKGLIKVLEKKNIPIVTFENWEKIDKAERDRGKLLGKPREKIVDVAEMLKVAFS